MLVGLLILLSSLNEGAGPAVYVAPDNYLLRQVVQEAADLGIKVTEDTANGEFLAGDAILVVNVHKLFNGKSAFGVGDARIRVGTIVIDDAHAWMGVVSEQFMIKLPVKHAAHKELLVLFEDDLKVQSELGLIEIKGEDPEAIMTVPFWSWYSKRESVLSILHNHRADDYLAFSWPLLKEAIPYSQCVFSGRGLEIAPRCLPVERLPSFAKATRRIYMTATLADDGVLVTELDADPACAADPIKPKGAGEIGDRMIIAPLEVNDTLTESDVKALAKSVAQNHNVTIIVPSEKRAATWSDIADQTLMAGNISEGVEKLKSGRLLGITVLVNRYDGVDLPDDACRLLIIDGLPEVQGLCDRVEASILEGTDAYLLKQIQKLEQGMGRGVRSAEDRCAVLLLGARLTQRINQPNARAMFTPATLVQMDLGREVTRQAKGKEIDALIPILNLCIEGNTDWWQAGRSRLAHAPEGQTAKVDQTIIKQREAFDLVVSGQHQAAAVAMQTAVQAEHDRTVRGYLRQQLAEITNTFDPAAAQQILLSAVAENRRVTKPLAGIAHIKLTAPAKQASAAAEFMSRRFVDTNALVLFANALAADLLWNEDRTDQFEAAMRDLGLLVGFGSQRPDKEFRDGGPDNLWAIGALKFLVIECKSGVRNDGRLISKDHCNQLLGARSWFKRNYDNTCEMTPILVHPINRFQTEASPSEDMRIIEDEKLGKLRDAIRAYGASVASLGSFKDEAEVARKLDQYSLTGGKFVPAYTKTFSVKAK
jgi:hypothetical protein